MTDTGKNPFPRFNGFAYRPILGPEPGVTRRDPSPVIHAGDLYHVWYSRTENDLHGYSATVWWATSPDGETWTERGEAIGRGGPGDFDEHAVFTPTTLVANGRFYLFYDAVPEPFTNDDGGPNCTPTAVGVAEADAPEGPWRKFPGNPVLTISPDPAEFDSLRVDDTCLIAREGGYWMYYKGRQAGNTPRNTKMGLAIADSPTGPYVKYEGNPVLPSGHEVCVWPHGTGVGAIISPHGPDGNTLQYSEDGLRFHRVADISPPRAPGPFRADGYREGEGPGFEWGVCQVTEKGPPPVVYLARFEADLRAPSG